MKRIFFLLVCLLIFPSTSTAFSTSAESAILMDMESGRVLYANNPRKVKSVASISKIMTAILAIESNKLDNVVLIGDEIKESYGSGIYIKVGESMSLRDLVYGLMLRSGNDAALAIAKYVSGSVEEFVKLMNEKAKDVGMKDSVFNNPSGLDEKAGNYSTAYDMAILTKYAMQNPEYRKIVGTKKHTVTTDANIYSWTNKHKLLNSYKYTTGGKTGFTEKARRTLVTTASYDGMNLVAVTLNDGNDFLDHTNLFKEAFSVYKNYNILKKGTINIKEESYYKNRELYIEDDFSYILKEGDTNQLYLKFELEKKLIYKSGDVVGIVKVFYGDEVIYEGNVYVGSEKNIKKSFWEWLKSLW